MQCLGNWIVVMLLFKSDWCFLEMPFDHLSYQYIVHTWERIRTSDVFSLFYIYKKQSEMDDMTQLVVLDSWLIKSILYSVSKRVCTFNVVCVYMLCYVCSSECTFGVEISSSLPSLNMKVVSFIYWLLHCLFLDVFAFIWFSWILLIQRHESFLVQEIDIESGRRRRSIYNKLFGYDSRDKQGSW